MDILQSIILGLLQGATEFFPVSSTGHLILAEKFIPTSGDAALFNVILHVGTLIAILLAMQNDINRLFGEMLRMIGDLFRNLFAYLRSSASHKEPDYARIVASNYRKMFLLILTASVSSAVVALPLRHLGMTGSDNLIFSGAGFLLTGVLLLVTDRIEPGTKVPRDITYVQAAVIGLIQGVTVLNGISRTGIMIVAGILLGFGRKFAIRFSFLLSVPVVLGALILDLGTLLHADMSVDILANYSAGLLAALIAGLISIGIAMNSMRKSGFKAFAYYSFVIGTASIICSFIF